jgi:hypothetical protein
MENLQSDPITVIGGDPLEGSGFKAENPIFDEQAIELEAEQVPEEDQ